MFGRRFQNWWHVQCSLWKFFVPAFCNIILSVVCYAVGWHLSTTVSSMPLARAGALATAIAIAFTLYNYHEKLEVSEKAAYQKFKKVTSQFPITGKASQQQLADKLKKNTRRMVLIVTIIQAAILIVATLVWGFGDLATQWIKSASNSSTNQPRSLSQDLLLDSFSSEIALSRPITVVVFV